MNNKKAVSSRFRALLARSRCTLRELTNFITGSVGIMCKKTSCLSVGLLVFGLLDLSAKTTRSVDSSSELTLISSSVLSFWHNDKLFHHDIV